MMIERGWIDRAFIDASTVGFDQVAAYCRDWTLEKTAEVTGVPARRSSGRRRCGRTPRSGFMLHARGIEHHSNGVQNTLGSINLVLATGRIGRPHCGYGTIVGQANGQGGREHGQKCDQLPGWRDITNPEHRSYIAGVWGIDERDLPGPGVDAYEMFRKIDTGEIKGLISICFNPEGLAARQQFRDALPRQARVLRRDRFLPQRHSPPRRHRAARQPARGRRRHGDAGRRAHHQGQQGGGLPGRGAAGLAHHPGHRARTRSAAWLHVHGAARDLRRAAHREQGRRRRLFGRDLRKDRARDGRVLALLRRGSRRPASRSPIIPGRRGCSNPAATTRSRKARGRFIFRTVARASTSPTTACRSTTSAKSIRSS